VPLLYTLVSSDVLIFLWLAINIECHISVVIIFCSILAGSWIPIIENVFLIGSPVIMKYKLHQARRLAREYIHLICAGT